MGMGMGMGMGNVKLVDVNGSALVSGRRPRCNRWIGGLVNEHAEPKCVQEVKYSNRQKKRASLVEKNTITYVWPLSSTAPRERRY